MKDCLDEKSLWSLHEGEGSADDRAHLEGCLSCARRYRQLTDDLRQIVAVLKQTPPPRSSRKPAAHLALRWSLAAAVVVFAFLLGRMTTADEPAGSVAPVAGKSNTPHQLPADYAAASYGLYIDSLIQPQDETDSGQLALEDQWTSDSDGF
jgi:hypothetical protein